MAEPFVQRVYDVRIAGFEESLEKTAAMTLAFEKMDKAKRDLNASLKEKSDIGDTRAVTDLTQKIKDLEVEIEKLRVVQAAAAKETLLLNEAERKKAAADLANQKIQESIAKTELIRIQTIKLQNAESEKQANASKKQADALLNEAAAAESTEEQYRSLAQRRRELQLLTEAQRDNPEAIINFEGQELSLKQSVDLIQKLKIEEQAFVAQLRVEKNIHDEINIAEEGSLTLLSRQANELRQIIANRNLAQGGQINFQGLTLGYDDAIKKLRELEALEEIQRIRLEGEEKAVTILTAGYTKLKNERVELQKIVLNPTPENLSLLSSQGLNIDSAIDKIKQMKIEEKGYLDQLKIETDVKKATALVEEGSLINLRTARAELAALVNSKNTQSFGAVDFRGQIISIDLANEKLREYDAQIKSLVATQKSSKEAADLVAGSYNALELETQQLTSITRALGPAITSEQWDKYRFSISQIIPEMNRLSLQEVQEGKALDLLKQKIFENQVALRNFNRDISGSNTLVGDYTKGIIDAFKNLGLGGVLQNQRADVENQLNQVLARVNELRIKYNETAAAGGAAFEKIDAELREAVQLHARLKGNVDNLNNALKETPTGITSVLQNGFQSLDGTIKNTLVTYIGFQAAISAVTRVIDVDKELSDKFVDLQRILKGTTEEIKGVEDQLRSLDTRTSLTELTDFALISARAGVAQESISGVVSAINKLQLIAGNELGNVDVAITAIVKLINIFEGPGKVTEENVLRFGNALVQLANEGVATGEFLVNFGERLSGIKGITDISIQSVLGLAAAFEETGATSEIAATSVTQILLRIGNDIAKYAKLAQKPLEEFRQTLRDSPAEALLQLAEGIKGDSTAIDEIGSNFADLAANGVRVTTIFGDMAAKADFFREKIALATEALGNQDQIIEGAIQKERTFAATLENIGKQFELAFSNRNFVQFLDSISQATLYLIKLLTAIPFGLVITGLSLLTAVWAFYKGNVISAAIAQQFMNEQSLIGQVRRVAERLGLIEVSAARAATTAGIVAQTAATEGATVATVGLNTAMKASPLGLILAGIALIIPLMAAFASKTNEVSTSVNRLKDNANSASGEFRKLQTEVNNLNTNIAPLADRYDELTKKTDLSVDEQKEMKSIVEQVTSIMPSAVTQQDEYGNAIAISTSRVREFIQAEKDRLAVVNKEAISKNREALNEVDEQIKIIDRQISQIEARGTFTVTEGRVAGNLGQVVTTERNATEAEVNSKLEENRKLLAERRGIQAEINLLETGNILGTKEETELRQKATGEQKRTLEQMFAELKVINDEIAVLAQIQDKTHEQLNRQKLLRQQREQLEKEIKEAGGTIGGSSRTSTGRRVQIERDELREIETLRDKELTVEKLRLSRIEEVRKLSLNEEINHLRNLQEINDRYDVLKIEKLRELLIKTEALQSKATGDRLAQLKSDGVRLNKEIAETQLAISTRILTTNDQIQALHQKAFDEESKIQKKAFENRKSELQLEFETLSKIPDIGSEVVAVARKRLNEQQIAEAKIYYDNLISLARSHRINTQAIEEERMKVINDLTRQGLDLNIKITEAHLKDLERAYDKSLTEIQNKYAKYRETISANPNLNQRQVDSRIEVLNQREAEEIAAAAVAAAAIRFRQIKADYESGKATLQQLEQAETDYLNSVQNYRKVVNDNMGNLFQDLQQGFSGLATAFSEMAGLTNDWSKITQDSFALAEQAMNDYFEARRSQVQREKEDTISRIELDNEFLLARAQSQAEEDTLNREAAQKKEKAEKEAGERLKKIKRDEAKISLATELANIAASAAANVLNGVTFGAAGAIQYAFLSALAVGRYLANLSAINSATFEYGGNPDMHTIWGGKVKGRSHRQGGNPFIFKGRRFEDEVDELNIIRTKNAPKGKSYTISGTQEQIASKLNEIGGGRSFSPGAILEKFEFGGSLDNWIAGSPVINLSAPVNSSSFLNGSDKEMNKELRRIVVDLSTSLSKKIEIQTENINNLAMQTNTRIDNIKVFNVASETGKVIDDVKKANQIGTL